MPRVPGSVNLAHSGVQAPSLTYNVHGHPMNPNHSTGGTYQTEGMSEEMRFKLEMRKMELEEAREIRRLELEVEAEEIMPKAE